MNRITRFFMKRRTLFWSLMFGILLAGVLSFLWMPKLEDPAVAVKQVMVIVPYPGASAHEVEQNVAQMMEDELRSLPDVAKIKTECQPDMALISIEFKMTVLLDEIEQHFDLVRRKVNDVKSKLPSGTYDPVVVDDMMDVYGIFYSLSGDGYDYPELEKYAKYIRREILSVPGVKRVNIGATRDETVEITISKEELMRNGMLPTQLMMALQSTGKPINSGSFNTDEEKYRFEVSEGVSTVEDLQNLQIKTPAGKTVRLGDIARIEQTLASPQRNGFYVNGQPALTISVAMEHDAIVPDVGKEVDAHLQAALRSLPTGLETEKIFFQPEKVSEAISGFMLNLIESVIIVILVLVFAMGFRSGLIVGFGLILTIALSFPILLQCGTTLQRISLGAFIVAMGMLVDNAVVIMDGILIDRKRGLPGDSYLYRIGQNTAMPLLGATLITAATFICVYLSPDSVGEYAGDLFLVLCVSLLASWVLALIQVPVCAAAWLPEDKDSRRSNGKDDDVMNAPLHKAVRKMVIGLINHKWMVLSASLICLGICVYGMMNVKNAFFPDFDYKQFIVECYFPPESPAEHTEAEMKRMSRIVEANERVDRVALSLGATPVRYCLVRPMASGGDAYGELLIDCKDYHTVEELIPELRQQLRDEFPDAYIRLRKYNFSISSSHEVEVEFAGPDPAVLKRLSAEAETIMRNCPYVDAYSVQNNWQPKAKKIAVDYDIQSGLRAGISREDVGNALLAATDGLTIGVMSNGDKMMLVNLNVRDSEGRKIEDLTEIPVWSTLNVHADGEKIAGNLLSGHADNIVDDVLRSVPLGSVARGIELSREENIVRRLNGRRVIEAECDPDRENPEASAEKVESYIKPAIEAINLPEGYSMRWVGVGELQSEAIGNLLKYVPLTIFLILLILLLLFNDWRKVLLILVCFPFVICGMVVALLVTGNPFTFMATIGILGLIGMMVKNSIVLVDEIGRLQREESYDGFRAVVEATVSRTRPVLLASVTTIVGMIPLLGDPMYGAMAVTIMGGLAAGTIITLMLLPILYIIIMKVKIEKQ